MRFSIGVADCQGHVAGTFGASNAPRLESSPPSCIRGLPSAARPERIELESQTAEIGCKADANQFRVGFLERPKPDEGLPPSCRREALHGPAFAGGQESGDCLLRNRPTLCLDIDSEPAGPGYRDHRHPCGVGYAELDMRQISRHERLPTERSLKPPQRRRDFTFYGVRESNAQLDAAGNRARAHPGVPDAAHVSPIVPIEQFRALRERALRALCHRPDLDRMGGAERRRISDTDRVLEKLAPCDRSVRLLGADGRSAAESDQSFRSGINFAAHVTGPKVETPDRGVPKALSGTSIELRAAASDAN